MAAPRAGLYDLDDIAARLRQRAEEWIPEHFPHGRRDGGDWRLANIKGDPPRKNGSCVITLKGVHAGDWIDFDGGEGGGPIDALARATGLSGRELFGYAAKLAGLTPSDSGSRVKPSAKARPSAKDASREIDVILSPTVPIAGTVAEHYLKSRSLADPAASDLVFHAGLAHRESRTSHPSMVAIVRNQSGERIAIHRTWLSADGNGKANVETPRMMLGPMAGGAVRLAEIGSDNVLGVAEGIETALSVMAACPNLPVWATLSAAGLERVVLPRRCRALSSWPTMTLRARACGRLRHWRRGSSQRSAASISPCPRTRAMTSTTSCSAKDKPPSKPSLMPRRSVRDSLRPPVPEVKSAPTVRSVSLSAGLSDRNSAPMMGISPDWCATPGR
jgi:Toprim domain-containing protein